MPEPVTILTALTLIGTLTTSAIAAADSGPDPVNTPLPPIPAREDATVQAARRAQLNANFSKGRRRTLLAGSVADVEPPEVGIQTLLGG